LAIVAPFDWIHSHAGAVPLPGAKAIEWDHSLTSPDIIMPANSKALSPVRQFLADHPEVQTFEVVITDLNGILRGKWLPVPPSKRSWTANLK
jgi:hypothetical protein